MTRTEAEYAAVLADLLIEAGDQGCDIGAIMSMAGERIGPIDTAVDVTIGAFPGGRRHTLSIGAMALRLPIRRPYVVADLDWNPERTWGGGEGSPPPTIDHADGEPVYHRPTARMITDYFSHGRYTPCGCQRAVVERGGHVESVIVHRAGCWARQPRQAE